MEFVVFRDLVCAAPLAFVLLLAEIYGGVAANEPVARATAEVFFSRALAVILLSSATRAWNGAEIEQAVDSALYAAHAKREPLATAHVRAEIEETRPLSVVMAERIDGMRNWAAGRTVSCD